MPSQAGSLVLLKAGNGASPEIFAMVGGLNLTSFIQRNQPIDITTKDSGGWQELLERGGISKISISGSGRFEDSAAEEIVRSNAMNNVIRNYQIGFGNGDVLSGKFLITSYQRGGANSGVEAYTLAMASSGPVTFTNGEQ